MKKIIFCVLSVFAFMISLFSFSACVETEKDSGENEKHMLCSFDEYDSLSEITYAHSFGKVDILDECEWKTEGKACIKASIDGSRNDRGQKPMMVLYADSQYVNKTDFSDVATLELDVYNDNDETKYIYFQLEISQLNTEGDVVYLQTAEYSYELPAKKQTHVTWEFDRGFLMQLMDIKSVTQILLSFDNPTDGDFDVYYLDNFYATTTNRETNPVQIRKEGEIESGERAEYLAAWSVTLPKHCPTGLAFNSDPNYVKYGKGSIMITAPDGLNKVNTPTVSYEAKQSIDLTDYESIVFHMFNANEKDYNGYFVTAEGQFRVDFSLKAGEWTRVEISLSKLKALAHLEEFSDSVYKQFSSFQITLYFQEPNTPLTFYLDEMYAVTGDTRPPEIGEVEYEYFEKGETVNVLKPQVIRGNIDKWEVFAPDGEKISENEDTFVASENGIYTVVYKAWNAYDSSTYKVSVKVGYPDIKQTVYGVYYTQPTEFVVPVFETNATLTWQLFNNENGQSMAETENKTSYMISDGEYFVEYTATNEIASETARVYINCKSDFIRFDKTFNNFYSEAYFEEVSGGDPVFTAEERVAVYGEKAVKVLDSTVKLVNLPLYGELSDNKVLNFSAYNPSDNDVKLKVSGDTAYGEFVVKAKTRRLYNIPFSWLKSWGAIVEREDGVYIACNFGTGASPLYVYLFGFTEKAATTELTLSEYTTEPETDGETQYTVPKDTNGVWKVKVYENQSGKEISLTDGKFVPEPNYEYRFVYSLVNVYGEFEKELSLKFHDSRRARFSKVPENALVVPDGTTVIKDYLDANKPTASGKDTVISYTVRRFNPDNPLGDNNYAGESFDYTSYVKTSVFKATEKWVYRIRWTVANEYGATSHDQYIYALPNAQALTLTPDLVEIKGAGAEFVKVGNAYRLKITTTGAENVTITIKGNYSAYAEKKLTLLACNQSEYKARLQAMNSQGVYVGGYNNTYAMQNNGAALCQINSELTKTLVDYLDADGNIVIKFNVNCAEGTPELYVDFFAIV